MTKRLSGRHRLALFFAAVGILLVAAGFASRAAASGEPVPALQGKPTDDYCLSCHSQAGMTKTFRNGETLGLTIDKALFQESVHEQNGIACVDCHTGITEYPHPELGALNTRQVSMEFYPSCRTCHAEQYEATLDSVHQKELAGGNARAAVCTDCHNPHTQTRMTDPDTGDLLITARLHIPQTCARCHSAIYDTYKESVHGKALTELGNLDVPTCIDCHGVHNIQDPTSAEFRNNTPLLCAQCHANDTLMRAYGLSTDILDTYVSDFHGTTVTLFEQTSPDQPTNKPVCTDCHGVHEIRRVDDPQAGIAIKQNLLQKCQRCHPDVTAESFTDAWMSHYVASPQHNPLVYYVNLFYRIFIPSVIGGMLIFVLSDFIRRTLEARKGSRK